MIVSNLRTSTMSAFYFTDSALCSQTDLILKAQLVICSHTHTHVRGKTNTWISAQSIMRIFFWKKRRAEKREHRFWKKPVGVGSDVTWKTTYMYCNLWRRRSILNFLPSFPCILYPSIHYSSLPLSLEYFVSLPVYELFVFDAIFNRS